MPQRTSSPSIYLRIALWLFVLFTAVRSFSFLGELPKPSQDAVASYENTSTRIEGIVTDRVSGDAQRLTVRNLVIEETEYTGGIYVYVPTFPALEYGDRIRFRCTLSDPEPFDGFAYDQFLAGKRIYKTCTSYDVPLVLSQKNQPFILQKLHDVRSFILIQIGRIFGEPHGTLLAGLLLGESSFSPEWDERFSITGTTHIVAASGYNVAIVSFLLFGFLTFIGIRRQQAFWVLLLGITLYVLLAGAEAAIVRAGIMGGIILLARHVGRKAKMDIVLLLTASIMLMVNPYLLRYDVGFQLSMASTVALIYIAPGLMERLQFLPEAYAVRESVAATLSATLFSLPFIILSFGSISVIGIVANVFILPLIPYAMLFGAIAVVSGMVSRSIGIAISLVSWVVLSLILLIIYLLSEVPFASFTLHDTWKVPIALGIIICLFALWKSGFVSKENYS